jgi:CubicO group peptidase (beta-lactamase class C family)
VRLRGYGQLAPDGSPVTDSSIYDLASLTKVIATTSAVMLLVDRGRLDLDARVASYLPEWRGNDARATVTLRNLLLHNSGLPAFAAFYRTARGREQFRAALATQQLATEPGSRTVYSDLGFILLGLIVEQVAGEPLDELLARELFRPLGLRETAYNPLLAPRPGTAAPPGRPWPLARIAPTEQDTFFRHQRVHGVVHDENAYALGGVSGHAGLFSSARDLAVIAQLLLDRGQYAGRRYLADSTVAGFSHRQSATSSRALGWDTPSPGSSAGDLFSSRSFGHTGFTGTSVWIDPERAVFVVLLTNRVYAGRENQQHAALRRAVADAVQRAIRDQPLAPRGGGQ